MWRYALASIAVALVVGWLAAATRSTPAMIAAYAGAVAIGAYLCAKQNAAQTSSVTFRFAGVSLVVTAVFALLLVLNGTDWLGWYFVYFYFLGITTTTYVAALIGSALGQRSDASDEEVGEAL